MKQCLRLHPGNGRGARPGPGAAHRTFRGLHPPALTRSASDCATGLTIVLVAGGFQKSEPGRYGGTPAKQRTALAFGHPAPDSVLDAVVEGLGQALRPHGTPTADGLRTVLLGPLHEEVIRNRNACRIPAPITARQHPVARPLDTRSPAPEEQHEHDSRIIG